MPCGRWGRGDLAQAGPALLGQVRIRPDHAHLLIVPLGAVTRAYAELLSGFVPMKVFRVALEPYRSWILLAMTVVAMNVTYRRVAEQQGGGTAGGS